MASFISKLQLASPEKERVACSSLLEDVFCRDLILNADRREPAGGDEEGGAADKAVTGDDERRTAQNK